MGSLRLFMKLVFGLIKQTFYQTFIKKIIQQSRKIFKLILPQNPLHSTY